MNNQSTSAAVYIGPAADRNNRAVAGARELARRVAQKYDVSIPAVGRDALLFEAGWRIHLNKALSQLQVLRNDLSNRLAHGGTTLTFMGRCAASIATLPAVVRHHPEAYILWLDAHGDCNSPSDPGQSDASYLGGMVLTGCAGEWDTGLGGDLDMSNVLLVGSRDLDPPERKRLVEGRLRSVAPGADFIQRLLAEIGDRSIYLHLDCDVLDAGLVPSEYQVDDGITFAELHELSRALDKLDLIGVEIAEYEATWPDGSSGNAECLLAAVNPLLEKWIRSDRGKARKRYFTVSI